MKKRILLLALKLSIKLITMSQAEDRLQTFLSLSWSLKKKKKSCLVIQKRSPPHSNCLSLSLPQWPCSHLQQQETPNTDLRVGSWYWLLYIFLLYLTLCSPLRLHKQNHRQASKLARESVIAVHCALQRESASITVLVQQSTFRK